MDKRIILYAFKICMYYFLKTFLPIMFFGSKIDYSIKLDQQIGKLKTLIRDNHEPCSDKPDILKDKVLLFTDNIIDNITDNIADNITDNITHEKTTVADNITHEKIRKVDSIENLTKLQETITSQLRDRYGNDVIIDFTYSSTKPNTEDENTEYEYALKIKRIGGDTPIWDDFAESEIYVHTEKKVFYVRTKKGFRVYPLNKKSIIKCVK